MPDSIKRLYLLFSAFLFVTASLNGANHIIVATIGASPSLDRHLEPEVLVDQVISFWEMKLKQVLPDNPDLIVLPEFCDLSGAGHEYLSVRKNRVLEYFASIAQKHKCYIAFGMMREDAGGDWFNSVVIVDREGRISGIYDKNYPTIGEMEQGIKASNQTTVFQLDFGRVAVAICFDLNFDELREKYARENPDLILFSSMYHGGFVQKTWAYSCRAFFVGSIYRGTPSEIRNPLGDVVASTTNYQDFAVAKINLDSRLVHLDYNRPRLKALKEKYGTSVKINDPGELGVVLVVSEDEDKSVDEMIREFDIELVDDYFDRARNFRLKNMNRR